MKIAKVVSALLPVALSSGCATVVNGPNLDYAIESNPKGAKVMLSTGAECVTPCKLELRRSNHIRADIAHEGYKPAYVLIQSKAGGATIGNALAGGMIGVLVDSGNGSNRFLSPRPLNVQLAAAGSDEEAQLLDKKGNVVSTLAAHNDEARPRVVESLGRKLAGYEDTPAPEVAEASAPAEADPVTEPSEDAEPSVAEASDDAGNAVEAASQDQSAVEDAETDATQ